MSKKVPYLFLLTGTIIVLFFMIIPLLTSLFPTFFTEGQLSLNQYIQFFKDPYNQSVLIRTIRISVIVMIVCVSLGIPTAYFIAGVDKKWKGLLMAMTLFPLLTNSVIRSFAWINILGKNGIINSLLMKMHLIDQPMNLLYSEFAIIIGSVYLFLPTMIMTLVGVMESIEPEMLEAAETLGAHPFTAFRKIILPLSIPGAIVGSILVFTGTLTAYTTPQLLGGNQKMVLSTLLYQKANTLGDWTQASILAFIMIVTTLFVMSGLNWLAKKADRRVEQHA